MSYVYRKTIRAGEKAKSYRMRYLDADGNERDEPVTNSQGRRVRDKRVAIQILDETEKRVQREIAGAKNPELAHLRTPIRVAFFGFLRHVRSGPAKRRYAADALSCCKTIFKHGGISTVGEFTTDNLATALGRIARQKNGKGEAISPRTVNWYRECAVHFGNWLTDTKGWLDTNPAARIPKRKVNRGNTRKNRRALSIEESRRLLSVCGPRRTFYAVQMWAGLRVGECKALTWGDILDLDTERPYVRVRASIAKASREDEIPLHAGLASLLRKHRPPGAGSSDRLFATAPKLDTLKEDLKRANISVADEKGRTLDRHALRTTFVSWLGEFGVDPREQVALARHSLEAQSITLRAYQDFSRFDLHAAIAKLPNPEKLAVELAVESVRSGQKQAETDHEWPDERDTRRASKRCNSRSKRPSKGVRRGRQKIAAPGLEPGTLGL